MANKKFIYFVSLSSNVPYVLNQALKEVGNRNEVSIFFDLDGARVLDNRYLKEMEKRTETNLTTLIHTVLNTGIKLYGCQMNVLIADGLELIAGAELAGVATFLNLAFQADAVLSY
jgi:predicted peroxiredoxin